MIRLRKILLCSYPYYILLFLCILITIYRINLPLKSNYNLSDTKVLGIITNINIDGNKLELTIKSKEKIKSYYYFESKEEKEFISNSIHLGDKFLLSGKLKEVEKNKTKELFDYKKYLKTQKINLIQETKEIILIKKNKNIFYSIKQFFIEKCQNKYLKVFILGDKNSLSTDTINSYRELGISHLFAISGMHITLLSSYLLKLLKKCKISEEKRYFLVSLFLVFYLFITGITPSILRSVLFFIFFSINHIYYFYIKSTNIYIMVLCLCLFLNPYYLYDIGFLYSFTISFSLIIMAETINQYDSYLKRVFFTSLISFISSIPITLYYFNQVNLLSIIYNIFYVPYISIIVFPLALLTFIFPFLESIFEFCTYLLEKSCSLLSNINFFKIIFCSNHIIFYLGYVVFIIICFIGMKKKKFYYSSLLIFCLLFHYFQPIIFDKDYLMMLDVGQGDSILLHSTNQNVLIDTGGVMSYYKESWQQKQNSNSVVLNTTIPMLKKLGISKLDYLILTHGDYDHLGEASILLDNFKVKQIYINEGYKNYLERNIISKFSSVKVLRQDDKFQIGNIYFLSLNHDLEDENDSSIVLFAKSKNKKLLLTGDASKKTEKEIMKEYDIGQVDILKLGHHGSKTSSGEDFIKEVNPKLALISAGKDNKFNHPNKETIDTLKKYKIKYLITYKEGCIKINL